MRRFGVFKPVGTGLNLKQAFSLGSERVGRTLGATFKITTGTGKGLDLPTPKGFKKKKTKGGILFIEQPKFRLSTGTELKEIQSFRRR